MTTSTLLSGRANAFGSRRWLKTAARFCSTPSTGTAKSTTPTTSKPADAAHQRELFVNVLNANATRRDAKQYLARFEEDGPPSSKAAMASSNSKHPPHGARHLPRPTRAIAEDPQFVRHITGKETPATATPTIHVALVILRAPQTLSDSNLDGVAMTLSQLVQLDMRIVLVLDCDDIPDQSDGHAANVRPSLEAFNRQAERLNVAISKHSVDGARLVDGALEIHPETSSTMYHCRRVTVGVPDLLLRPLKRSTIPILPTLAFTPSGQAVPCPASSVMNALTSLFSGLSSVSTTQDQPSLVSTSLDRIILLDNLGGIPSSIRGHDAHVFINLEQELGEIKLELTKYAQTNASNDPQSAGVYRQHVSNLQMVQDCLSMLPSASSALIITPEEAASSSRTATSTDQAIGTGTRRQKNTLIHNLLTNKPMVSPSLPVDRLRSSSTPDSCVDTTTDSQHSTLIKRGMSLTIVPNAAYGEGWQAPVSGKSELDLEHDPRVDLSRLVYLIEDSFHRKLDVQHYLARIRGRTAGLIVAGAYDGGAILTWEQPPGSSDPSRRVPYLDKFAVLSSSQGSAGVADILFQAMVRTCFPRGVCWRSRKDNPVNKWYFERADGHWQIPGTNWTMFWTGAGVVDVKQRWDDYVAVCSSVEASWLDVKKRE